MMIASPPVKIPPSLQVTEEQFRQLVKANPDLRLERTAAGELIVMTPTGSEGDAPEAETCFQQALEVSRSQQAKSLELRAAMSLARLWQSQGKYQDAHDLLAPVYNWFTEGFDTADLIDAKSLLDELTEASS